MESTLQGEEKATERAESRRSLGGTVKETAHSLLEETGTFQVLHSTQN